MLPCTVPAIRSIQDEQEGVGNLCEVQDSVKIPYTQNTSVTGAGRGTEPRTTATTAFPHLSVLSRSASAA